jgi:hypothetical protein
MRPLGRGRADAVGWLAVQRGDWYSDPHRAWSAVAEGGYRWLGVPWTPWLRGGLTYASGDDDRGDFSHGTFFPALPSTRPGLLAGTFAQMNLSDVFAELRLRPRPRVGVSGAVHRLSLASDVDRWYSGTGATAVRGTFFGYTTRGSNRAADLGTLVQLAVDSAVSRRWSLRASLGVMRGGQVVRGAFAGNRLTVLAFENLLTF